MTDPDSLRRLLITLALLAPLALAEFGGGLYLLCGAKLSRRARRAGGGLVVVALTHVAGRVATAALFWDVQRLGLAAYYTRIHYNYGVTIAVGWVEATALFLVVRAALTPRDRAADDPEARDG